MNYALGNEVGARFGAVGFFARALLLVSAAAAAFLFAGGAGGASSAAGTQALYSIRGQVTESFCAGYGVAGVTVTLSGGMVGVTQTGADGSFSFANLPAGGTYTVTVSKTGYSFDPSSRTVANLSGDVTQSYRTPANISPNIRGHVYDANGKPIAGLRLNLDGYHYPRSEYTGDLGQYLFSCLEPGRTYTVTPDHPSYSYAPASRTFANQTETQTADFTATPLPAIIKGRVTQDGAPLKGVLLKLQGDATAYVTTGDDGTYSFNVAASGTYFVTPSKEWLLFTPQNAQFTQPTGTATKDFAGARQRIQIALYVRSQGFAVPGATLTLSGGASATATTDRNGIAYFNDLEPLKDYTVTVAKDGVTFDKPSRTWEYLISDKAYFFDGYSSVQDGMCVTSLSPASLALNYNDAVAWTHITAPQGCVWTATSSAAWLTPASGQRNGTGSRDFGASVTRNTTGAPRTATVSIGGKTLTVTQGPSKRAEPEVLWISGGGAGGMTEAAVSPDRQTLATASGGGSVKLWRYSDGQLLRTIAAFPSEPPNSLAFSPDGQLLAAAGPWLPGYSENEATLKLYRVADGSLVRAFNLGAEYNVNSVRFTPDGTRLVTGSSNSTLRVYRVSDGAVLLSIGPFDASAVAVSPDGALLAATGKDYWSELPQARVWRLSDGALVRTLEGLSFISDSISFSPDGRLLAAGDWGGNGEPASVLIWKTADWSLFRDLQGPPSSSLLTLAFSPDGSMIAAGGWDAPCIDCVNSIFLWRVADGLLLNTIPAHRGAVAHAEFSDNATLYSRGGENLLRVWEVPSGRALRTVGAERHFATDAAFTHDGQFFVSTNAHDDSRQLLGAELFRVSDGARQRTYLGHNDIVNAVAFSPDDRVLATASGSGPPDTRDTRIFLWDTFNGTRLRTMPGHEGGTTALAYAPNGQLLASGGRDKAVRLWNPADGAHVRTLTGHGHGVYAVAFSPDGQLLASGSGDAKIKLWRTSDGALLRTLNGNAFPVNSLAFSKDGQTLVVGFDSYGDNIQLWRVGDGTLLRTFGDQHYFMGHVSFSGDETEVVSTTPAVVWFWSAADGSLLRVYDSEVGLTYGSAVAVSPDGTRLGVARYDQTVEMLRYPTNGTTTPPPPPTPSPNPTPTPQPTAVNVALAANGGVVTASSTYDSRFNAASLNNGDRKGLNWGAGGGWNDATANAYPDWVQVSFSGAKSIGSIDVFTVQDNFASPSEPTQSMTFSKYGVTSLRAEYWTGTAWAVVPASASGASNGVWRRFSFAPLTTDKIRVVVTGAMDGYSRLVEVEAWQADANTTPPPRVNVAAAASGATATASSQHSTNFPAAAAINGDRKGLNWGGGGGWNDATSDSYPDWLEVNFNGAKTISEVDVFTVQDAYASPSEPSESSAFTRYGLVAFDVQYWDGAAWQTVPGGAVNGNNLVWRKLTFAPVTTTRIRVVVRGALAGYSRITEVEAY